MNKRRVGSIALLVVPLFSGSLLLCIINKIYPIAKVCDESKSMLFNIILCIIGFAVTAISIAFMFNRSKLFKKESKLYFIDTYFVLMVDLLLGLMHFFVNSALSLIILTYGIIVQLFIIFHYYFKEIFNVRDKNNHNTKSMSSLHKKLRIKVLLSIIPMILLSVLILPIFIELVVGWYYIIVLLYSLWFAIIKDVYFEKKKINMKPNNDCAAVCGLYCGTCPSYLDGKCAGCLSEDCACECIHEFKKCAEKQCITRCYECSEFPCESLKDFSTKHIVNGICHHENVIQYLQDMKDLGVDSWVAKQTEEHTCEKCGELIAWCDKNNHKCRKVKPNKKT